jgi:hypothetical protein
MTCKLCGQKKKLCNSHILSECLFTDIYGKEKHDFNIVTTELKNKNQKVQKGIREYLLCEDCEQQFGRYESYFYKTVKNSFNLKLDANVNFINVDYKLMKLFFLSILWRTGISSNRVFINVTLKKAVEDKLRQMLIDENPGKYDEFGCYCIYCEKYNNVFYRMIFAPDKIETMDKLIYRFMFLGYFWFITVENNDPNINKLFLHSDNVLKILNDSENCDKFIFKFLNEFKLKNKFKT